jgi:hypothetical protein
MSVRKRTWKTAAGEERQAWIVDYADQAGQRRLKTFRLNWKPTPSKPGQDLRSHKGLTRQTAPASRLPRRRICELKRARRAGWSAARSTATGRTSSFISGHSSARSSFRKSRRRSSANSRIDCGGAIRRQARPLAPRGRLRWCERLPGVLGLSWPMRKSAVLWRATLSVS